MAQFTLPQVPSPSGINTVEDLKKYLDQLYGVLAKWQVLINNTKFLGSASGHLTLSTSLPTATDGEDDDIWIKKS